MSKTDQEIRIRRLKPRDDRSGFHSGNIDLDRFFQRYAGQNQFRHHIGTTYVAVQENCITGFVTVSSGEMVADRLPNTLHGRLPSYPLPILRIARLAVDERHQGQGIGRLLLQAMLELALEEVNSIPDPLRYETYLTQLQEAESFSLFGNHEI